MNPQCDGQARLGDSSGTFVERWGRPASVASIGLGIVRCFGTQRQALTVLFDRDQAILIRYLRTGPARGVPAPTQRPDDFFAPGTGIQLHSDPYGWVLADNACSADAIRAMVDFSADWWGLATPLLSTQRAG